MNPCELNALVTAAANYLYTALSKEEFIFLNIFLSELSKSMFSLEILGGVCRRGGVRKYEEDRKEGKDEEKE